MEELLKNKDTIYFIIFLSSIGGSAILIKYKVNELLSDKEHIHSKLNEMNYKITQLQNKNRLNDNELYEIFVTKQDLNDKCECIKEKIKDLHDFIKDCEKK